MYKIVFEKQALKDLEKLKISGLSEKARKLVDIIRENPYQKPPRYEKLVGNLDGIPDVSIYNTAWYIRYTRGQ